ncbi:MAG: hypothetical protein GY940_01200, partial [bacterium]|nr:hypothetical protein [bacterium]
MKKGYIKQNVLLVSVGIIGLVVFLLLLPRFFPYRGANLQIGKSKPIAIPSAFLTKKGSRLDGFPIIPTISNNDSAFVHF